MAYKVSCELVFGMDVFVYFSINEKGGNIRERPFPPN